jgi:hypothetical protein
MSPTSRSTSDRATTSPKILRGLQHLYTTKTLRENIDNGAKGSAQDILIGLRNQQQI